MNKDIIKQILVKFKGDNTDLKKSINDVTKAANTLSKTTSLNQQYGTMDKFIKNISKANENLSKTFTIFQKGMRSAIETDMQRFERKAENQYKRIMNLQRELDKATSAGDRTRMNRLTDVMNNAGGRLNRSMSGYNNAQDTLSKASGDSFMSGITRGVGSAIGLPNLSTSALAGVAATAAVIKVGQMIGNSPAQEIANIRSLTDVSRSYYKPGTQGDLSNAYLMATDPTAFRRARHAAGTEGRLLDLETYTNNPLKTLENSIKTVFTSMPWNYESTMRKYVEEGTAQNFQNIKQSTMNPEKLAYLSGKAPNRLDFQRQFGLNDTQRYAYSSLARSALMTEDEQMGVSAALRDKVGSNVAVQMANGAGRIRERTGMALDTATQMLGSLSIISGGNKASSEQLIDIMAKAFSRGLDDAALAEKISAASIGMIEKSGLTGDARRNATDIATMASLISPNGQPNARTVAGAIGANEKLGQAFNAGGEDEMYRTQVLNELANQTNDPAAALLLLQKNYKDPMQMKNLGNDPLFADLFNGKTPDEINQIGRKALYKSVVGPMKLRGHSPGDSFLRVWNKTKDFQKSLNSATRTVSAFGAVSGGTPEKQKAYALDLLQYTGNEEIQKAIISNMNGSDMFRSVTGRQVPVNNGVAGQMGQNIIKQDQIQDAASFRDITAGDVGKAAAISQRQTKTGMSSGIDGSIDGVIDALENLKGSLQSMGGNNATSRAGGR